MNHLSPNHGSEYNQINNRMRLLIRALLIPALLSGFLYLRALAIQLSSALSEESLPDHAIITVGLIFIAIVGLLLSLRWEGLGGLIAVLCGVALGVLTFFTAKENPLLIAFVYSSPFIITGSLSLGYWWQSCHKQASQSA